MRCVKLGQLVAAAAVQRLQAKLTMPPRGTLGACTSMHTEQGLIAETDRWPLLFGAHYCHHCAYALSAQTFTRCDQPAH